LLTFNLFVYFISGRVSTFE